MKITSKIVLVCKTGKGAGFSMLLKNDDVVLFQGDSVTDVGRIYDIPEDLGKGYPLFISGLFAALYPHINVKFINRGISGNRTKDLKKRWTEDCINLKPTVVSILIGINDCWRRYDSNDPTPLDNFVDNYRFILDRTKEELDAKIILCEPFILPTSSDQREWREDLDPKIQAVRDLATEYDALLIPLDGVFAQASTYRCSKFWIPDGVHPSPSGHGLIAKTWLESIGAM